MYQYQYQGGGKSAQGSSMPGQGGMTGQGNVIMAQQQSVGDAVSQQGQQQFQFSYQQGSQQMNAGFNQMTAPQLHTQAEYLAHQRALQQANSGQYMYQAPMNNMMGAWQVQGTASPYRQQPGVAYTQQQAFEQQRLRQQMLLQQQQQGNMIMGQQGGPRMVPQQNPTVGQQTPNQVAQIMMGQQYPHESSPY